MPKKPKSVPKKDNVTPQRSYRFRQPDVDRMAILKTAWGNETFAPNETDVIRRALRIAVDGLPEDERKKIEKFLGIQKDVS